MKDNEDSTGSSTANDLSSVQPIHQPAASVQDAVSTKVAEVIDSSIVLQSPKAPSREQPTSQRLREIQDVTLNFFANASNETLGACAVGLCASTYLVLGRVGLVLIGAVGGIVLHATWEHSQHGMESEDTRTEATKRRREQALELASRALEWRGKNVSDTEDRDLKVVASTSIKILNYADFQPHTRSALNSFTDAVIRDYVKWWYAPVLPSENAFPASCRQILTGFILSVANHLSRKRTEDPFLDFIANSTSIIIVFLNELGTALKASPNQEVDAAIKTYLEYEPESSLANVLNAKQQDRKLRLVAEDILQGFLDSKTYDCAPAQVFLREVLTTLILKSTVITCSKSEWINGWIVHLLQDGEPEVMQVIDAGVENLEDNLASARGHEVNITEGKKHQRRVSRAEEAMQEAMREAQRMNEMIAQEDARKKRAESVPEVETPISAATTDAGIPTPTSSESESTRHALEPIEDSMIFDAEGNTIPSGRSSPARLTSPLRQKPKQFTHFEQLPPTAVPTALQPGFSPPARTETTSAVPLTLHNANITLMDMGVGNDRVPLKQKPNDEFLVQIEPASSRFPGWMVTRTYSDFEPLHQTMQRIAQVSSASEFNIQQTSVPNWKGQTREQLIALLEAYLKHALTYSPLAESSAMKKFLDKDLGLDKIPTGNKNVLTQSAAALDNVGKGFINVIGQGGKGIAGGGKAVLGGVQGVFGAVGSAVGPKKSGNTTRSSASDLSRSVTSTSSALHSGRPGLDFVVESDSQDEERPPLPSRPSITSTDQTSPASRLTPLLAQEILNLPPPPSEIDDEFVPTARSSQLSQDSAPTDKPQPPQIPPPALAPKSTSTQIESQTEATSSTSTPIPSPTPDPSTAQATPTKTPRQKQTLPLTEEETRITVDLIFAIITSTYSLSSAWTFRLSLLSAAKTYLLRPANPQLESIRNLLQESLINANTSDAAIAQHILKLQENTLPTEEELATWPKEASAEDKDKLRIKARKLLVERGMPQALTSVMGQAASGEALGKVFDCLQIEEVARGLVFAVMLQAIRAVMQ